MRPMIRLDLASPTMTRAAMRPPALGRSLLPPMVPTLTRGLSSTTPAHIRSSLFGSPFDDLDPFSSPLHDFFHPFGGLVPRNSRANVARPERLWSVAPRIDVVEEATKFVLSAELAGVKKEDVNIQVDADRRRLTIEGQTRSEYSSTAPPETATEADAAEPAADSAEPAQSGSQEVASQPAQQEVQRHVGHALVSERVFGFFARSFTLPPTADLSNESALKARFDNGLLRIEVPKKVEQHAKTRNIAIDGA